MTRSFIMSNWLNSKCSCILRCKRADVVGSQFWSTLCKRHYRELVASNLAASYCKMGCWFCGWAYLFVEEFESVLGMTREEFYKLPKWKQDLTKKKVDLF
ncbi:putative villin headpiece [Helianthus anomalus]